LVRGEIQLFVLILSFYIIFLKIELDSFSFLLIYIYIYIYIYSNEKESGSKGILKDEDKGHNLSKLQLQLLACFRFG